MKKINPLRERDTMDRSRGVNAGPKMHVWQKRKTEGTTGIHHTAANLPRPRCANSRSRHTTTDTETNNWQTLRGQTGSSLRALRETGCPFVVVRSCFTAAESVVVGRLTSCPGIAVLGIASVQAAWSVNQRLCHTLGIAHRCRSLSPLLSVHGHRLCGPVLPSRS